MSDLPQLPRALRPPRLEILRYEFTPRDFENQWRPYEYYGPVQVTLRPDGLVKMSGVLKWGVEGAILSVPEEFRPPYDRVFVCCGHRSASEGSAGVRVDVGSSGILQVKGTWAKGGSDAGWAWLSLDNVVYEAREEE